MQRRDALGDVEVDHDCGVLPVGAAGGLGVPAGFDQAHKRVDGAWQRGTIL
jgi:hypothetical protein